MAKSGNNGKRHKLGKSTKSRTEFDDESHRYDSDQDVFKTKKTQDFISFADNDDNSSNDESEMRDMGLLSEKGLIDDSSENSDTDSTSLVTERRNWGKNASNFYDQDMEDNDEETDDDENSEGELQIEEAIQLHKDVLKEMDPNDFLLNDVGIESASLKENIQSLEIDFDKELELIRTGFYQSQLISDTTIEQNSQITKEDIHLLIQRDHPEILSLLTDMKDKSEELSKQLNPILEKVETRQLLTSEGLSYLEMRSHLLLCYLQYLCYYVLLKLHGKSVKDHPVVERLIELRVLITQLRQVDIKLQPQIQRLLTHDTASTTVLRPRPELIGNAKDDSQFLSSTSYNNISDNTDSDREEGSSDMDNNEEIEQDNNGLYKPPKVIAMEYSGDTKLGVKTKLDKEKERNETRLKKSEIVNALREQFQETPLEINESAASRMSADKEARKMLQKQKERQEFEEENMLRLPVTKADKKANKILKQKQQLFLSGGSTLDDLSNFADSAIDTTFDDPTMPMKANNTALGHPSKFASSLSAVYTAADRLTKKRGHDKKLNETADTYIGAKQIKRKKIDSTVETHFGHGQLLPEQDTFSSVADTNIPDVIKEALETKQKKKDDREKKMLLDRMKAIPTLDETVDGKRKTNYKIDKNKGLTRQRKKIEGNARVHNRLKFEKKMKHLKAIQQPMREAAASGNYDGEATGIKTHLKKSVSLAS